MRAGRGVKRAAPPARLLADRRRPTPVEHADALPLAARSDGMRLAAEVDRLERELADARAQMAALETRAEIDPLTDVLNRRGFERELKRSLAHIKRYGTTAALLYIDLDGFKAVNDRHGHAAGDAVLKAVASVLVGSVRASDTVARLGGDEFAALLWNLSTPAALAKASALEQAVAATRVAWEGGLLSVAASGGVAELSADQDPAQVMARADAAMYGRKRARRAG